MDLSGYEKNMFGRISLFFNNTQNEHKGSGWCVEPDSKYDYSKQKVKMSVGEYGLVSMGGIAEKKSKHGHAIASITSIWMPPHLISTELSSSSQSNRRRSLRGGH